MAKLITGGTGFIGAELAHLLVGRGEEIVLFDRTIKHYRIDDIENKVKVVQGDLGNWSDVLNVVKSNKITHIYHQGTMVTQPSEDNPWSSFRSNVLGTYNVLEAARLFEVKQVMFASSGATFSLELGEKTTDITIQRPTTFYGIGKLYCESLGRYYRTRFSLDFRAVRYPAIIGPGDKVPNHWYVTMVENAVRGKPFICPVTVDSKLPTIMFIKDAARAAEMVLQAPKENIKMVNYNIAGVPHPVSPQDIERAIRKFIPDFVITYKPDPAIMKLHQSPATTKIFDDSYAQKEWGWQPSYSTIDHVVSAFIDEMKAHPQRYV